jgi:hypothetical protein
MFQIIALLTFLQTGHTIPPLVVAKNFPTEEACKAALPAAMETVKSGLGAVKDLPPISVRIGCVPVETI